MSEKPISPLRRRMIEDMTIRGINQKTQLDYIRHVKNFTIFLGRSPDAATPEDLRAYQLHQRKQGVQPPTMNATVSALRLFFTSTCSKPDMGSHLRIVKQPRKLPVVLTPEEVLLVLEAAPGAKYKTALGVAYGAGLRVSEVANLKVSDIDSKRMLLRILYTTNWYVYAKRPFAGPEQVLSYLARYTHRVAISNSRLIATNEHSVTFRVKDYRLTGPDRYKTMTLAVPEFIRRFMLHVLPKGFHRIRHYGLLAGGPAKAATVARARELIAAQAPAKRAPCTDEPQLADDNADVPDKPVHACPCCGARMIIIEVFEGLCRPPRRSTANVEIRIDTS